MRAITFVRNRINRTPFFISTAGLRIPPFEKGMLGGILYKKIPLNPPFLKGEAEDSKLNLSRYQLLREAYEPHILLKDRHCLHQLEKGWAQRQPLKGKIILVNIHLTRITLALITALLESGAWVEVTVSPELVIHQNTLQPLLAAQIPFYSTIPDEKKQNYYDIVYDCCAGMNEIIPNNGMVKLTKTDPALYQHTTFPIITVDSSQTKEIETGLGTGDSFVRVIHHLAQQSIAAMVLNWKNLTTHMTYPSLYLTTLLSLINVDQLFLRNKFMIFGFGKVGKGIASALESAGVPKKNIFMVDISSEAYLDAMKQGYSGLLLDTHHPETIQRIKKILPEIWAVVTATGIEGAISRHFSQSDFDRVALLVNMSTGDDFGSRFTQERILNGKKPANFMLDFPTMVMYLDPIFTLFLKAGEALLKNSTLKPGLNPIAPEIDQAVLADWMNHHGNEIWRHRSGRLQTEKFIQHLRQHPVQCPPDLARSMEHYGIFHPASKPERVSKASRDLALTLPY